MAESAHELHIRHLFAAELQFRLASAIRLAVNGKYQPLDLPMEWTHGVHRVTYEEIALREEQADYAAILIHRSSTYMMAVAVKDAIEAIVPELPKAVRKGTTDILGAVQKTIAASEAKSWRCPDAHVATAYHISRLVRNAFSHAPFAPTWMIHDDLHDMLFSIRS